jgi:hypothetical protein
VRVLLSLSLECPHNSRPRPHKHAHTNMPTQTRPHKHAHLFLPETCRSSTCRMPWAGPLECGGLMLPCSDPRDGSRTQQVLACSWASSSATSSALTPTPAHTRHTTHISLAPPRAALVCSRAYHFMLQRRAPVIGVACRRIRSSTISGGCLGCTRLTLTTLPSSRGGRGLASDGRWRTSRPRWC